MTLFNTLINYFTLYTNITTLWKKNILVVKIPNYKTTQLINVSFKRDYDVIVPEALAAA